MPDVFCVQSLMELVANEMANDACRDDTLLTAFHSNTLSHIRFQNQIYQGDDVVCRYAALKI